MVKKSMLIKIRMAKKTRKPLIKEKIGHLLIKRGSTGNQSNKD